MVVFKCAYELDKIYLAQVCFHSLFKILLAVSVETASDYSTAKEKSQTGLWNNALFTSLPIPFKLHILLEIITAD